MPPDRADCHATAAMRGCAQGVTLLRLKEVGNRHDGRIDVEDSELPGERRGVDFYIIGGDMRGELKSGCWPILTRIQSSYASRIIRVNSASDDTLSHACRVMSTSGLLNKLEKRESNFTS